MASYLVLISLSYVVILAVLIAIFIYSHAAAWIKFALLFIAGAMFMVHSNALFGLLGWPVNQELPAKFIVLSSQVNEPIKDQKSAGKIYLWLVAIESTQPQTRPRAYSLDYSQALHSQIEQAEKRKRRGIVQIGESLAVDNPVAKNSSLPAANAKQLISIYDFPDPKLPEK